MSDIDDLPAAELTEPRCGCCGAETYWSEYGYVCGYVCESCQLCFDSATLAASFLDSDAEVCGAACDNYWHGDHKIEPGITFDCGTCKLPASHKSKSMHWTGCQQRKQT